MNKVTENVRLADNDIEFAACEIKMKFMKRKLIHELSKLEGEEIEDIVNFITKNGVKLFPYEFTKKYRIDNVIAERDADSKLIYVTYNGKKLYLKKKYRNLFRAKRYFNNILLEQDADSPHCYFSEHFYPTEESVILDIGGAEGFFPIQYVDKVKKVYIFECDPGWVEALKKTYQGYEDKVVIIEKFVGKYTDETHVSLDDFVEQNNLSHEQLFIKIDAEGSESLILEGFHQVLHSNQKIKMALCTYHVAEYEKEIKETFSDWNIETSKGYMLYYYDMNFRFPYIRRGVLRMENRCE